MPAKTGSYLACFVGIAADLRETHLEHVPRDTLFELGIWCCVGVRVTLSEPPGSGVRAERFGSAARVVASCGAGLRMSGFDRGSRAC